jgi:hypothetical protein
LKIPFDYGIVINYALDGYTWTPSHYKDTGVLSNSVVREEGHFSEISP